MSNLIPALPEKEYFTTGEVASHFSVTSNAVFKWVKDGKIRAEQTPGGHNRISRKALIDFIATRHSKKDISRQKKLFQYCWEFHSRLGKIQEGCRGCIVYQTRAGRCYELAKLRAEIGHKRLFCKNSCEECDYYDMVHAERISLLIITGRNELQKELETNTKDLDCSLRFTDSEYHCSRLIESYHPDYVIVDCCRENECNREFVKSLSNDPRLPFTRIILAGARDSCLRECGSMVFAYLDKSFSITGLTDIIEEL